MFGNIGGIEFLNYLGTDTGVFGSETVPEASEKSREMYNVLSLRIQGYHE